MLVLLASHIAHIAWASASVGAQVAAATTTPSNSVLDTFDRRFVMETYLDQVDANGQPLQDAQGRYLKAALAAVEGNTKRLRTDATSKNWQPSFLEPQTGQPVPVNLNECSGCHRAAEDGSV
jgi:uracil-DNA glycosylase